MAHRAGRRPRSCRPRPARRCFGNRTRRPDPEGGSTVDTLIDRSVANRRSVRPAEAAALLGVCRDTVYVLMRSGQLRSVKAGRARLIPLAAIDEFLSATKD